MVYGASNYKLCPGGWVNFELKSTACFNRIVLQSDRRLIGGGIQQPMRDLASPMAMIEPIDKLVDELMREFTSDAVKGAH